MNNDYDLSEAVSMRKQGGTPKNHAPLHRIEQGLDCLDTQGEKHGYVLVDLPQQNRGFEALQWFNNG